MGKLSSLRQKQMVNYFTTRGRKAREAMRGPFVCPKCGADKSLYCSISRGKSKEKEKTERVRVISYVFSCQSCAFRKVISYRGKEPEIVTVYCKLYDQEVSPAIVEAQRHRSKTRYNVLVLPSTKVNMK